jgi:hypothetical protein
MVGIAAALRLVFVVTQARREHMLVLPLLMHYVSGSGTQTAGAAARCESKVLSINTSLASHCAVCMSTEAARIGVASSKGAVSLRNH